MLKMKNAGLLIALSLGACADLEQEPLTNEELQDLSDQDRAALLDEESALEEADPVAAEKTDAADAGPDAYSCYFTPALYDRGSKAEFWAYARCSKRIYVIDLTHAGTMDHRGVGSDIQVCYNNFQCTTQRTYATDLAGDQWWETLVWLDTKEYSTSRWRSQDGRKGAGF